MFQEYKWQIILYLQPAALQSDSPTVPHSRVATQRSLNIMEKAMLIALRCAHTHSHRQIEREIFNQTFHLFILISASRSHRLSYPFEGKRRIACHLFLFLCRFLCAFFLLYIIYLSGLWNWILIFLFISHFARALRTL